MKEIKQPSAGAMKDPAPDREKLEALLRTMTSLMENYISRNSRRSVDFSFDAKCSLLGFGEWGEIINAARAEFPDLKTLSRLDLLRHLKETTRDPRADKIYYHLRQFVG